MDDEIIIINKQNNDNANSNNINPNNKLLNEDNLNMIKTYLSEAVKYLINKL